MSIQLSDHFTYRRLIRFTFPSIVMMLFTSIYGVVDGIFVSNFVGKTPFAALNLIMPVCMLLGALGFMVGTGGAALPVSYFCSKKAKVLRLGKPKWNGSALVQTCLNGSSEMMTNLSLSLVNMLYNFQLMRFAGEDGVAAYGVIMYVNFIFISVFIGYSVGSAPVIGFHYGAQNREELHGLLRKSLVLMGSVSVVLAGLAIRLARPLSAVFVSYDPGLYEMTVRGFSLYSLAFLFMGVNIFASSFFTALSNGPVSAAISFLRTLLFQVAAILLLPRLLGLDGIWLAIVAAEMLGLCVSGFFFLRMRPRYGY